MTSSRARDEVAKRATRRRNIDARAETRKRARERRARRTREGQRDGGSTSRRRVVMRGALDVSALSSPTLRTTNAQLVVACALTALLGGALQLHKLASLDSAGRQFSETSTAAKVSFLVPFALAKSCANLVVGAVADSRGRRRVTIAGWSVALCAPILGMMSVGAGGFTVVTLSALFLGCAQGLTWTALVLASVDLCGKARRGLASGLNETIGYTAIAIFAEFYGSMERRGVSCGWKTTTRSGACVAANAAETCATADDWVKQCVGECVCRGYMGVPMGIELMLCLIGSFTSVFVFRESSTLLAAGRRFGVSTWASEIPEEEDKSELRGNGEESSDGGSLCVVPVQTESLSTAMRRTTWENKNTMIVCIAAFCANFETAVAWGLMSVWARDQLGLSGRERDFFTGCYSFMKGFTQIASGLMSDRIGRKLPISFGLIGGAVALLIATFGAGFHGKFMPGDVTASELKAMQLAYLTLSSVALGFCTGVTYPVLAAAAVDHAPDESHYASTLGVVRFWRDLGYVMGVPIAAVADSSSAEVALILVSVFMASAGFGVHKIYEEKLVAGDDDARQSAGYTHAPTDERANDARQTHPSIAVEMSSTTS